MSVDELIRKKVLLNAVTFKGKAKIKSVMGKILSEKPEMRSQVQILRSKVSKEVEKVNKMSLSDQKKELKELGGVVKRRRKKQEKKLPPLHNVKGDVVLRFAPNPNTPLHIGHARQAVLNWFYKKKYHGTYILRYDDTDPKRKVPLKEAYDMILEELEWLGIKPDRVERASKRLKTYYKYFEDLIKEGHVYVCTCEPEKWRSLKEDEKPCPCRGESPRKQMNKWKKMKKHKFKEREAIGVVKTDLEENNPAIREWVAFRIVDKPKHPFVKRKYVWPTLNFQSAIDDHEFGITHVIRGTDLKDSEDKQEYLYEYLGWDMPETMYCGMFALGGVEMSSSIIKRGIEDKKFRGWHDPRLGTLEALKKRGFSPKAIRELIRYIGPKPQDITISEENLYAYNRKEIDFTSNRYFFVENPVKIKVKKPPKKGRVRLPLHPDDKGRGTRKLSVSTSFYISKKDFQRLKGVEIRLKELYNIRLGKTSKYTSKKLKNIPKIHWVPLKHVDMQVVMPDASKARGYGEIDLKKTNPDDVLQLERFGFVRIDSVRKNKVVAYFTHP